MIASIFLKIILGKLINQEPIRRMVWWIYQLVTWLVGIALFIGVMYLIFRLRIFPALIVSILMFWIGKKGSKIQQLTNETSAIQALCIPLRRLGATATIICITLIIAIKLDIL